MKAVRVHKHGGLEKLIYESIPEPKIQPKEFWWPFVRAPSTISIFGPARGSPE
jgi:NADPH:quinone reductase-like Zn-dependent oxidoreductase